jgi:hypothetical protein
MKPHEVTGIGAAHAQAKRIIRTFQSHSAENEEVVRMKKIICIVLLTLLPCLPVHAFNLMNPTGNDWLTWDRSTQIGYTAGFLDGANGTALGIFGDSYRFITGEKAGEGTVLILAYALNGVSIAQIIDGLNQLYANPENRGIPTSYAVHVVYKQLRDAPDQDIEQILLWLRSGASFETRSKYLSVRNSAGITIKRITFP